ncbi:MAG TPA: hypothetical protein VMH00_09015 [Candidatus Limnocylindrales bacterium]|nr:hypothetical protein [Candidatus Limnocylindrales bacterium]
MNGNDKIARTLVILGAVILFISAGLHSFAAVVKAFPALAASNLSAGLQAAFRVIFLSAGWHWTVIGIFVLSIACVNTCLRKGLVLFCGISILIEAVVGAFMMGPFVGNEMIGSAGLLIFIGGLLFGPERPKA